jgi:hypothetical protein
MVSVYFDRETRIDTRGDGCGVCLTGVEAMAMAIIRDRLLPAFSVSAHS